MINNTGDGAYSELSQALAQRYEVIYFVNINTNEYVEFSSSEDYSKLKVSARGKDFFEETQENIKKDIFPDDIPKMSLAMKKDYVLNVLNETGQFVINYRLMLGGKPQYVTLFGVIPKEHENHIIFTVINVDANMRMEVELQNALVSAVDLANHDALTGALNKRAFTQIEMDLDKELESDKHRKFAIAIFDVNGLREINDNYGLNAGDVYIRDACTMIKRVFGDENVYRIGGDEFVVLLTDQVYEDRDELMKRFAHLQSENRVKGLVTVASGISDYQQLSDNRVQDVFERADKQMFSSKRFYKNSQIADEISLAEINDEDRNIKFLKLYEKLCTAMVNTEVIDRDLIARILIQIASMFRLSKAYARLYRNPQEEKNGGGEFLPCFDSGVESKEIITLRTVTRIMSIATVTACMAPDEKPLSDYERSRVELVMRTTLTYLSRNRLSTLVENLTYYDDDGYKNLRSYHGYIMREYLNLDDKAAFIYNLRHFSLINRELGSNTGNGIMKKHFEMLDSIVGDRGILCRLGGDNFVGICGKEQLGNVLTYLTEASVVYDASEGKTVNIASSVGVYRVQEKTVIGNPGDIMSKLIVSLHAAQSGHKDKIVFFDGDLMESRDNVMRVQQLFPEALRFEEFKVYYQPKVDIRNGKLMGAEALCRWFHDGEMVRPADFIPMLEETSDICKLDFYMLDHVCRDIKHWLEEGKEVVRVSVNLSRKHMINSNLVQDLLKIIDRRSVPHELIEIELTETTTDVGFSDLKRVVAGLQAAGIYTSVDDFGIGYSSLNLIRELPWNVIKVDRSFLPQDDVQQDDVQQDDVSRIMFKHIIAIANDMNIECIVEGVETEKQLELLREFECHYAQGFYYDKPLPKEDFDKKLVEKYYK